LSPKALKYPTGNRWKGISRWVIAQLPCQLDGSFISSQSHHNNHRLGLVRAWMGDRLGIPGAVSFLASPGTCSCVCGEEHLGENTLLGEADADGLVIYFLQDNFTLNGTKRFQY